MSKINRVFFFEQTRRELFGGSLKPTQTEGHLLLLDYWEHNYAIEDDRWLAYVLATAYHETAATLRPINEYGSNEYKRINYDVTGARPERARKNGNTMVGDGVKYAGRGFVQLTWKNNYARAGKKLGVDLVGQPDLALEPVVATAILFEGMVHGWFTGRSLRDCFSPATDEWIRARRIVNGLDRASQIAGYAKKYYGAISYTVA